MSVLRTSWLLFASLLLVLVGFTGCGGDAAPAEDAAPPPLAAAQPAPVAAQQAAAAAALPAAPPPPRVEPPQQKPKRPDDVAQWQPDDFRLARLERDPKLAEAITALGQRSVGKADALPLLVELLEPEKPPTPEEASKAATPRFGQPPGVRPPEPTVVSALIAAVGKNNTADSAQVLENLLRGKLNPGVNGRTVMDGVLAALVGNPGPAHYEMLLTATFTPEEYRPPVAEAEPAKMTLGGGNSNGFDAAQLTQEATNKLKAAANPELRMMIAARIGATAGAGGAGNPLMTMLLEPRADNLPAQILLFSQPQIDPTVKEKVQQLLTQLAMVAVDQMLGIPQNATVAAPTGYVGGNWLHLTPSQGSMNAFGTASSNPTYRPLAAELPPNFEPSSGASNQAGRTTGIRGANATNPQTVNMLASLFWNPAFRTIVLGTTAEADGIEKTIPSAILAASIPAEDTRARLAVLNKSLWELGPRTLKFNNIFGDVWHDPGLLLVFKGVPRKEDPARSDKRSGKVDPRRNNGSNLVARSTTAAEKKEKPRYEWMQASEEMIYVLNSRFLAAARAAPDQGRTKATPVAATKADDTGAEKPATEPDLEALPSKSRISSGPDQPDDDAFGTRAAEPTAEADKLPVELHEGANVVAEYHLNWPADLQAKLPGVEVSPLIVHYVRIEESNRGGKLMTHYQKYLKGAKVRTIDRGRWLDQVDEGTAPGRRRSIDVMIANVNPPPPPPPASARGREAKPKVTDEPMVVEILSIEVANPYPEEDDAADAEKSKQKPAKSAKSPSAAKESKASKEPKSTKKPAAKPAAKKSDDDAS